jgi:hypothetical protein
MAEDAGFALQKAACTLFWKPDSQPKAGLRVDDGPLQIAREMDNFNK